MQLKRTGEFFSETKQYTNVMVMNSIVGLSEQRQLVSEIWKSNWRAQLIQTLQPSQIHDLHPLPKGGGIAEEFSEVGSYHVGLEGKVVDLSPERVHRGGLRDGKRIGSVCRRGRQPVTETRPPGGNPRRRADPAAGVLPLLRPNSRCRSQPFPAPATCCGGTDACSPTGSLQ
jgi:hypothetical protein